MNLCDLLKSYKDKTEYIIDYVENDGFENLTKLLNERQQIIDLISASEYSREDFRLMAEKLNLLSLEKKLEETVNRKKNEAKTNFEKTLKTKKVYNNYNKIQSNALIFTRKI